MKNKIILSGLLCLLAITNPIITYASSPITTTGNTYIPITATITGEFEVQLPDTVVLPEVTSYDVPILAKGNIAGDEVLYLGTDKEIILSSIEKGSKTASIALSKDFFNSADLLSTSTANLTITADEALSAGVWKAICCVDVGVNTAKVPGLYDEKNIMLADWDELTSYGLKVDTNVGATNNLSGIINNNTDLTNGVKLVIPDDITAINATTLSGSSFLTNIVIPDTVTEIGLRAFADCSSLQEIRLPKTISSLGNMAFQNCKQVKRITVPSSMNTIGDYTFRFCENLETATFMGNINTLGNGALAGCDNLKKITFHGFIDTIGEEAFSANKGLQEVIFEGNIGTLGKNAFKDCKDNTVDNNFTVTFEGNVETVGESAFYRSDVKEITFMGDVGTLGSQNGLPFVACDKLEKISFLGSMKNLDNRMFAQNQCLQQVVLSDDLETIGQMAFMSCTSLSDITIPNSVTTIGANAFSGCSNLASIVVPDTVTSVGNLAFYQVPVVYYNGPLDTSNWGATEIRTY